ncbi:hypothetical protein FRB94_006289 [Tulasnella sp. JGI-2019a]|nr:hypothetical protein FRB94_006289 [Tulasnella sp. JGI-2019a]
MYDNYDDDEDSIVSMTDFLAGPKDANAPGVTPSSSRTTPRVVPIVIPTSGPQLYEYRRAQWLQPTSSGVVAASASASGSEDMRVSKSHARLEAIVNQQGVEEDEGIWKQYLSAVHESLVGGKRLKKGIKLNLAVKILRAGWLRDGTWDTAAAASFTPTPSNGPSTTSSGTAVSPQPPHSSGLATPQIPREYRRGGLRALITRTLSPWDSRSSNTTPTTSTTSTYTASSTTYAKSAPSTNYSQSTIKVSAQANNRMKSSSTLSKVLPFGLKSVRRMLGGRPPDDIVVPDGREITGILDMMHEAPFPYKAMQSSHQRNRSASVF